MINNNPTVVSLFAGAGGMDQGFRDAGFNIIWANELNHKASESYIKNIGSHLVEGDIRKISSTEIPSSDIIIGGPPCQGFSVAGKMDPNDPRSELIWEFFRVVSEKKPLVFVMENVKALAVLDKWKVIRELIVSRFQSLGYNVGFKVLNASHYGVPQKRERVFFIGTLHGSASDFFPKPIKNTLSVRDALKKLPPYGQPGNDNICKAAITPAKSPIMRASPYAGMLFNGCGRPIHLESPSPTLPASMGGNKTPIIDQKALESKEKNWVEDYHAQLIGGGNPLTFAPSYLRRLTVEECSLIQSFPNNYIFCGSQSSKYCQIGNAVPPLLAFHVAKKIKSLLFQPIKPNKDFSQRQFTQLTLLDFLPREAKA